MRKNKTRYFGAEISKKAENYRRTKSKREKTEEKKLVLGYGFSS